MLLVILKIMNIKLNKIAKKYAVNYSYLFMKPDGIQLSQIANLISKNKIKQVIDKIFPLEKTVDVFEYLEAGHAHGKVVIKIK